MKKLFLSLVISLGAFSLSNGADDKTPHTYEGKISGVVCAACKEHVTAALTKKLPGFVSVEIKNTDTPDKKLTVVATNDNLTKEAVTEALGSYAKNYQVLSLEKRD